MPGELGNDWNVLTLIMYGKKLTPKYTTSSANRFMTTDGKPTMNDNCGGAFLEKMEWT